MLKVQFKNVNDVYEEFKDAKRQDVQSLLDWIEKQPHLPKIKGNFRKFSIDLKDLRKCFQMSQISRKSIEPFSGKINSNFRSRRRWKSLYFWSNFVIYRRILAGKNAFDAEFRFEYDGVFKIFELLFIEPGINLRIFRVFESKEFRNPFKMTPKT